MLGNHLLNQTHFLPEGRCVFSASNKGLSLEIKILSQSKATNSAVIDTCGTEEPGEQPSWVLLEQPWEG